MMIHTVGTFIKKTSDDRLTVNPPSPFGRRVSLLLSAYRDAQGMKENVSGGS